MKQNELWKKIRLQLYKQDLTSSELARKASLEPYVISSIKSGRHKDHQFGTIVKIADALDVSLDYFREETDDIGR